MKSSDRFAVLAIDPGRTTGVAACHFDAKTTLKETLLNAEEKKAVEVGAFLDSEGVYQKEWAEITHMEPWLLHSRRIAGVINRFSYRALIECEIPAPNIHIVFEDFVLRRRKEGGATGDLTSIWVMAGAMGRYDEGHVTDMNVTFQQAGEAKGFATNARLKLWGLYEPGSEHCKDAWRHLATLANKLIP